MHIVVFSKIFMFHIFYRHFSGHIWLPLAGQDDSGIDDSDSLTSSLVGFASQLLVNCRFGPGTIFDNAIGHWLLLIEAAMDS